MHAMKVDVETASGNGPEPTLNVFSATALLCGLMIGSGIFSTPATVWQLAGSPDAALILWAVGGLVTFAGMAAYVELGCMLPKSGGEQAYLDRAFRRPKSLWAFLFCLSMMFCIRPGAAAADSTIFGKYLLYSATGPRDLLEEGGLREHYDWISRALGVVCISSITLLNIFSAKWAIRVHDVLTTIKVLILVLISVTGIVVLCGGASGVSDAGNWQTGFSGTREDGNSYASALFKIFWAYDGWTNLSLVLGELKNPRKNLPIAAGVGVSLVTILYILANVAYITVVPAAVAFSSKEILAGTFAEIVFGPVFGKHIVPLFVSLSTYGAVCAMVFSASRVIVVAAEEGYLPFGKYLGAVHPKFLTPVNAILLNWFWTMFLMLAPPPGDAFNFLVDLVGYPSWFFYGMSVVGLVIMRFTERDLERTFRVWIPVPIVFIGVSIFLCVFPFVPPTDASALVNADGAPFYLAGLLGVISIILPVPLWWVMVGNQGDWRRAWHRLLGRPTAAKDDLRTSREKTWNEIPQGKFFVA